MNPPGEKGTVNESLWAGHAVMACDFYFTIRDVARIFALPLANENGNVNEI
jgi:hypothetical protein